MERLKEAIRRVINNVSTQLSTIMMYGQHYVMSTGRGGIQWRQQKTKELAFIELGPQTEMWTSQLNDTLFEKVCPTYSHTCTMHFWVEHLYNSRAGATRTMVYNNSLSDHKTDKKNNPQLPFIIHYPLPILFLIHSIP